MVELNRDGMLKMLVVDDEVEILQTYKEMFGARNWRVFTTPSGTTALALIEKENLDIVLLDIRLPDKTGIEILKEIKRLRSSLPVIIVTALGYDDNLVNEAIQSGASGYVSKNVPLRELMGAVQNALTK